MLRCVSCVSHDFKKRKIRIAMQGVGIFCDLIELLSVIYGLEVFIFIGIFIKVGVPGYTNEDNYVLVPYNFDASVYNLVSRLKKKWSMSFSNSKTIWCPRK